MRRKKTQHGAEWLLVVLALGGLAWFWWHAAMSSRRGEKPAPVPAAAPVQIARVMPPTNAPAHPVVVPPPPVIQTDVVVVAHTAAPPAVVPVLAPPSASLTRYPRPVQTVFEAQVALARQAISCGSIDGRFGSQTRSGLLAFQRSQGLRRTGELDAATRERLMLEVEPCAVYTVTAEDLARLQPVSPTWVGKSQQTALEFESILELVAEMGEAHPSLIRQLNPEVDWSRVTAGTQVELPETYRGEPSRPAAFLVIRLEDRVLEAFDSETNLLAHFPCSIARHVEKRPVGELHVTVVIPNPNYTFKPEIFPESAEARRIPNKLVLPPGPNSPVGVAWIGLDKAGYGIHGTPSPEQVGRTESHGCFRLANWNAEYLVGLVGVGTPVYIEP